MLFNMSWPDETQTINVANNFSTMQKNDEMKSFKKAKILKSQIREQKSKHQQTSTVGKQQQTFTGVNESFIVPFDARGS